MFQEYRKTATVLAKLFERGDEDGFVDGKGFLPYISTLENPRHYGVFGKHYLCVGVKGEKWLVEKEIFESTYELVGK